ncbi:MAG: permease-like cell division protein FtsX [Deltaproteobacteria bacterium]|nr:permease-like cell division protein FtsX [Deltaproteobacteria bacterium]
MLFTSFKQTRDNVRDNFSTTFSGVITTTISVSILGVFILIYLNLIHLSQTFFQQSHYSIFLSSQIKDSDKAELGERLSGIWGIKDIHWTSSEQARDDLLAGFSEAKEILEKIDFSKLPNIVEFSLNRVNALSAKELNDINKIDGVEEVFWGRETKDQINLFFDLTNFVGYFLIGMLLVSIFIIIRNTIYLSVQIRIEEIKILNNIGATKRFIKFPYVLEGILISFTGYFIAIGVIYLLYQFIIAGITYDETTYQIRGIVRFFDWFQLLSGLVVIFILGVISSFYATDKVINRLEL